MFWKAYPSASRGSQEAEEMGKVALASQFVTGFWEDIKAKLAGCDGDLDQLLVKARFEEAKIKDLGSKGTASVPRRPVLTSEHIPPHLRIHLLEENRHATVPRTPAMDVEGPATTFANVRTTGSSQRKLKDSRATKLLLLCQVQRSQGGPLHQVMCSGRMMQ